jgi:hypothetical protein
MDFIISPPFSTNLQYRPFKPALRDKGECDAAHNKNSPVNQVLGLLKAKGPDDQKVVQKDAI